MNSTVVVVGGGYGGIATARALDEVANVVLVEPRDTFVHNVAALRGLVDPAWTERMFLPYDRLLRRGRIVRDRAVAVDPGGVTLGSGDRLDADYLVLATGSTYPFPAKVPDHDHRLAAARFGVARQALAAAGRVLLLGAGPVGLELAGEIAAVWPATRITVLDPAPDLLTGDYPDALRIELRRQLADRGVELVLGTGLTADPPTEPGTYGPFTVTTGSGRRIDADLWFRCFGVVPRSDYLTDALATARRPDGYLTVTDELRLAGQQTVFAVGDVTAIPESKRARAAGEHAEVVAANIATLIEGGTGLRRYQPGPDSIVLPLGPTGGASYAPGRPVLDAATTVALKSSHLKLGTYRELLRLDGDRLAVTDAAR